MEHEHTYVPDPPTSLYLALLLSASLVLLPGCETPGYTTTDDDAADDDDDASDHGDDDATGDDDTGDDDTGDDDTATDDDTGDDDVTADDDTGDDDTAPSPCTVWVGVPKPVFELSGTCHTDPAECDGGSYGMGDPAGSCAPGLTCCIDTDQCVTVMGFDCVATQEECPGEPPDVGQFPQFGCPPSTPVCCSGGTEPRD